jgi:hypothetical protein
MYVRERTKALSGRTDARVGNCSRFFRAQCAAVLRACALLQTLRQDFEFLSHAAR